MACLLSNRFVFYAALTVVFSTVNIGCNSKPSNEEQVNVALANLSDAALDPEAFQLFFVDGMAPDDSERPRYREYFYEMGSPAVSGNSATAGVRITNAAGEVVAETTWDFSKVDEQWKIGNAPLP